MKFLRQILPLALLTALLFGQDMLVPVSVQYPLFLKILTFDDNLELDTDAPLVIGVVFQSRFKKSLRAKDQFIDQVEVSEIGSVKERRITFVTIDLDQADLEKEIESKQPDLLYISPLRGFETGKIYKISRQKDIVTLTGVPDYVVDGASIGLDIKRNKPQIIINLKASKEEGAQLKSQVLKLARIVD